MVKILSIVSELNQNQSVESKRKTQSESINQEVPLKPPPQKQVKKQKSPKNFHIIFLTSSILITLAGILFAYLQAYGGLPEKWQRPASTQTQTPTIKTTSCKPMEGPCLDVLTFDWYYDEGIKECVQPKSDCKGSKFTSKEECEQPCIKSTPANWKTYSNQHEKYQYSYPPDWQNEEPCPSFTGPGCGEDPQNSSRLEPPATEFRDSSFAVEYYQNNTCQSFLTQAKNWTWKEVRETKIIINNQTATQLEGTPISPSNTESQRKYILADHQDTCYILDILYLTGSPHAQTLSQILSTFRFLDNNP